MDGGDGDNQLTVGRSQLDLIVGERDLSFAAVGEADLYRPWFSIFLGALPGGFLFRWGCAVVCRLRQEQSGRNRADQQTTEEAGIVRDLATLHYRPSEKRLNAADFRIDCTPRRRVTAPANSHARAMRILLVILPAAVLWSHHRQR